MAKKYWVIEAWDGSAMLYQHHVLYCQITEKSMKQLLRTLTERESLTVKETIPSYATKRSKIYRSPYEVTRNQGGASALMCGDNPQLIARVEELDLAPL